MIDLSVSNCSYSLAKKDANLRPVAQRTLELFARELVSIYEVKIPARFKGLNAYFAAVLNIPALKKVLFIRRISRISVYLAHAPNNAPVRYCEHNYNYAILTSAFFSACLTNSLLNTQSLLEENVYRESYMYKRTIILTRRMVFPVWESP